MPIFQTARVVTDLYHKVEIGPLTTDGNLFLAPLAGFSDRAFRSVCVKFGANFSYTEMVSSEGLIRDSQKTKHLLLRAPNEQFLAIQLFGSNPETMAKAAAILLRDFAPSLVDINAGCPVKKVTKTGSGAALTRDYLTLGKVVAATVKASEDFSAETGRPRVPITVKIRSGWGKTATFMEAAKASFEAGAAAITLHPRSCEQGYSGRACRDFITQLSEKYSGKIPIFASGDVFSPEDARNVLAETRCDAVMFARGATGNPFIFENTRQFLTQGCYTPVPLKRKIDAAFSELKLLIEDKGEDCACREMRKRFCAYTKGMEEGARLRKIICESKTFEDYRRIEEII